MEWTGGCLCGGVRYHASGEPMQIGCCHCRRCQKFSGSAFWTWVNFDPDKFEWTKGEPKLFRSSKAVERGFCPECGSALSFHRDVWTAVSITSLDRPEVLKPLRHIWIERQFPWFQLPDDVPQYERFPEGLEHLEDPEIQ